MTTGMRAYRRDVIHNINWTENVGLSPYLKVNIATNKIGHLIYMEEYYSVNSSDKLKLDSRIIYYNDTMKNNTLTLKIKRPLDKNGEQYNYVKAIGFIDNEKVLNSWYKYVNRNKKEDKKSPGFGIAIIVVSILSVAYIIKRKKR